MNCGKHACCNVELPCKTEPVEFRNFIGKIIGWKLDIVLWSG